jgi:hypothetical protein
LTESGLLTIISTINFTPVADSKDENDQPLIFDFRYQPIVAHPVSPEFSEALALQRLTKFARILERNHSLV